MNLKIKKKYIYTIVSTLIFKMILEYGYFTFVNPLYAYSGFTLDISQIKIVESYLLVIIITSCLSKLDDSDKPSKVVIYLLFVNLYLPISSLYWLQNNSREYFFIITFSFLFLYLILDRVKQIKTYTLSEGKNIGFLFLITITVIVYGFLIMTGGLQRLNLNLLEVYNTRKGYADSSNVLIGYLLPWQAHVVNLTFLIYGLIKKNKLITLLVILLQVFLFSMTNFKSFLFAPLVVLGLYLIFKKGFKNSILLLMTSALSTLLTIMILLYKTTEGIVVLSIFLRRLFFVPANLHYTYFNFFEGMEKYKLSHSILTFIYDNPYNMGPVDLVARDVFGLEGFSPNVGIFGDAYLNFGLMGIIIFVVLLGSILVLFDSVAMKSPLILSMTIIIIPSMSLVNSGMFTSLATHGILFAIFVTWLSSTLLHRNEKVVGK